MSRLAFKVCLIVLLFPYMAYAAKTETPPQWVVEPSSAYPDVRYIIGLGEGGTQKEAEAKAVESLAAIFNRSISSQTSASMSYSEGKGEAEKNKNLKQDVTVSTDVKELIGVEVKERWTAKDGTCYALAAMERQSGVSIYTEKAMACIGAIEGFLNTDESEKNTFSEYFRYSSAVEKAAELQVYSAYLSVLEPLGSRNGWNEYAPDVLRIKASKIAKNIVVAVVIEGEEALKLKPVFEKIFSRRGFTLSKADGARYVMNVNLELEPPVEQSRGRIMIRYTLDAELKDSLLDETLLPFNLSGREIMFDQKAAKRKILKTLQEKTEDEFEASFAKYISGR